ncbi:MAG: TIGR04086 family membrane protein [Syntrophomonadaceae bacterium]|nr:TIGR04086 family membrane protein [Syntrophomonadaceae bacterium]
MPKMASSAGDGGFIVPIMHGITKSIILTIALSLLFGIIFYFTNLSENLSPPISSAILVLCAFLGGATAAKTKQSRGLLVGLLTSAVYFLLLTIFSLAVLKTPFYGSGLLQKGVLCLFAGGLGGIFGLTKS